MEDQTLTRVERHLNDEKLEYIGIHLPKWMVREIDADRNRPKKKIPRSPYIRELLYEKYKHKRKSK